MRVRLAVAIPVVASAVVSAAPVGADVGRFAPWVAYPTGRASSVVIADVDGDDRADVVAADGFDFNPAEDFSLLVFSQREDGGLDAPVRLPTAATYGSSMALDSADLDGDGDADVVVATLAGVEVFLQQPAGLESAGVVSLADAMLVEAVDVGGDGLVDLVVRHGGGVAVVRRSASGAWDAPQTAATAVLTDMEVADVTGDARPDIVGLLGSTVQVYAQGDDGSWGAGVSYPTGGVSPWDRGNGIAAGDLTGDGLADVAVSSGGNRPNAWIALLAQQPDGTLGTPEVRPSYDIPEPVELADLHGDGRLDVVTAHGGWNRIGFWSGLPEGTIAFGEQLVAAPYASHYAPKSLAVGDVSGDGVADVVVADYNHGVVVIRGDGPNGPPQPSTTITSGPSGVIDEGSATFTFEASDPAAWFECAFGDDDFDPCASPVNYADVTVGPHTFEVRAVSPLGGADQSPAVQTFRYEPTDTIIVGGPQGTTYSRTATFEFVGTDDGSVFECARQNGAWTPCSSPVTYSGVAEGAQVFSVRAITPDGAVDPTPAQRVWIVSPPDTTISAGPTGTVPSRTATFSFSSPVAGTSFECQLDGAAWTPCTSPSTFSGLPSGQHLFAARARTADGLVDPTPAQRSWTVAAPADLTVVLTDAPDPVKRGSVLAYTLTATNAGPGGASAVTMTLSLPSGVASPVVPAGCSLAGSTVSCSVGDLAVGRSASWTVSVTVTATKGTVLAASASVSGTSWDENSGNNTASASTRVR